MIGMLMVHVGPTYVGTPAGVLYAVPHGRASILFMLVAGVGVSLLAASRRLPAAGLELRLIWRALLLLPLGLLLQAQEPGVNVILQSYALLFLLAIGLVRLPTLLLLLLGLAALVLGPVAVLHGQMVAPEVFHRTAIQWGDSPSDIAHRLVLSGPYPLVTWIVPFVVGLWLGRCRLGARSVRVWLILGGVVMLLLFMGASGVAQVLWGEPGYSRDWRSLTVLAPHSQMPLWLGASTAAAVLVLGLALVIADWAGRWVWPLVVTGQFALTFYVGHLIALILWRDALVSTDPVQAAAVVLAITAAFALLAVIWRHFVARGPLEWFLFLPWMLPERRRRG